MTKRPQDWSTTKTVKAKALEAVEQNGIVFIDEIDKVAKRGNIGGADVSREGVQRDLLPLIEGCTVNTKLGMVKTDHILFIASGAFHLSKPSDLVPELTGPPADPRRAQGAVAVTTSSASSPSRMPRSPSNTASIAGRPRGCRSRLPMMASSALREIAWQVNEKTENIGARRLAYLARAPA